MGQPRQPANCWSTGRAIPRPPYSARRRPEVSAVDPGSFRTSLDVRSTVSTFCSARQPVFRLLFQTQAGVSFEYHLKPTAQSKDCNGQKRLPYRPWRLWAPGLNKRIRHSPTASPVKAAFGLNVEPEASVSVRGSSRESMQYACLRKGDAPKMVGSLWLPFETTSKWLSSKRHTATHSLALETQS